MRGDVNNKPQNTTEVTTPDGHDSHSFAAGSARAAARHTGGHLAQPSQMWTKRIVGQDLQKSVESFWDRSVTCTAKSKTRHDLHCS